MDRGSQHCTGGSDQNYPKEKEMQKAKMVEEALQIAKKKKEMLTAKEKRKDTPI